MEDTWPNKDLSAENKKNEGLEYRIQFSNLVTAVSANFINMVPDEIDQGICRALQVIGEFAGADSSYVFLLSQENSYMEFAYEWCAVGVEPTIGKIGKLYLKDYPWSLKKLSEFENIFIPRVEDLPPEAKAEKELLLRQNSKSLLILPIACRQSLLGFLGFATIRENKNWSEEIIALLNIVGIIFANALERKQAEEQLSQKEQQYRTTINSLADAIHVVNHDLRIVLFNEAFKKWNRELGLSVDMMGKNIFDLFPFLPTNVFDEYMEVFKTGKILASEEINIIHGKKVVTETRKIPIFEGENVSRVLSAVRNITERKEAEEQLRESEEKYRTLIEAANDAIFLVDAKTGNIIDANKRAGELIGMPVEKIIGLHQAELHPKGEAQFYKQLFHMQAQDPHGKPMICFVSHKDGRRIPVQISATRIKVKEKSIILGIFRDITDLMATEESLRRDRDGLKEIIGEREKELDRARKELEDAKRLSDIGVLAATVAHELRNPLGVIKTAVYNIKRKKQNEVFDNHIKNIEKKVAESEQIIRNLLSYSQIKMPNFAEIEVISLLKECLNHSRTKYAKYAVQIEMDYNCSKDEKLQVDPLHLTEVFTNILDNAYQSLPASQGLIKIVVDYDKKEGKCCIYFHDNGLGIDKKDFPSIFDPFFTTKSKGTGLGLTVCNQLINLHDGEINITSTKREGTTVVVILPIKQKL